MARKKNSPPRLDGSGRIGGWTPKELLSVDLLDQGPKKPSAVSRVLKAPFKLLKLPFVGAAKAGRGAGRAGAAAGRGVARTGSNVGKGVGSAGMEVLGLPMRMARAVAKPWRQD